MNKPPMYINVIGNDSFSFQAVDDPEKLDVTGCDFADMIKFDDILAAQEITSHFSILQSTLVLNRVREYTKNDNIGILEMILFGNKHLLIIDEKRELHIKV